MTLVINALFVATNKRDNFEVERTWSDGLTLWAKLKHSALLAELDLSKPESGWKIFPN